MTDPRHDRSDTAVTDPDPTADRPSPGTRPDGSGPRIAYLAHDLGDPAIRRRVAMLTAGGAAVTLAGFTRGDNPFPGTRVLGQSADARLLSRASAVASVLAKSTRALIAHFGEPDVIIARNLEMLAIAARLRPRFARRPRLVYECLDIHRLLTAGGPAAAAVRTLERRLAPGVDLVLTSSPAFVAHHLGPVFGARIAVVENRVLDLSDGPAPVPPTVLPGPPWRIGWFGALRCRRSLDLLSQAAKAAEGGIEVILRGRPSPAIFPNLPALLRDRPHIRFEGPYDPAHVARHYADVHFAWCIDMYESGANSEWLLPNRLYESLSAGAVPIALSRTEAGRMLSCLGIGLGLPAPTPHALSAALAATGPAAYRALVAHQHRLPRQLWAADRAACTALVRLVAGDGAAEHTLSPSLQPRATAS